MSTALFESVSHDSPRQKTGWQAQLTMCFAPRYGKTALMDVTHSGPLRVQRPFYPEQEVCHVYLLHPPGGLVGGDGLNVQVNCLRGAHCLLTTPGSTKFYRSAGEVAEVVQTINLESQAKVEWFPQETIFFNGAKAQMKTSIHLQADSQFMGWEISCLGLPVNQEQFLQGNVDCQLLLTREQQPLLIERLRVNQARHLTAGSGLRGFPMLATFIATGCDEKTLEIARAVLSEITVDFPYGVTLLDDVLVLRLLGHRTERIQRLMIAVWQKLRPLVLHKPAILPRIWAT